MIYEKPSLVVTSTNIPTQRCSVGLAVMVVAAAVAIWFAAAYSAGVGATIVAAAVAGVAFAAAGVDC